MLICCRTHLVKRLSRFLGRLSFSFLIIALVAVPCLAAFDFKNDPVCATALTNNSYSLSWEGTAVTGALITSPKEARKVCSLATSNEDVRAAMDKILGQIAGADPEDKGALLTTLRSKPEFYDLYLSIYDRFVPFSSNFMGLIRFAHKYLPLQGTIADLGAGPGIFSSRLTQLALRQHQRRHMLLVDISPLALGLARRKMQAIQTPRGISYSILEGPQNGDLTKITNLRGPNDTRLDGALINNVLYLLPEELQENVLKMVHANMITGTPLVIMEPNPEVVNNAAKGIWWAESVIYDGIANGATGTDFQIAMGHYIMELLWTYQAPSYINLEQLRAKCHKAGFTNEIAHLQNLYFGTMNALVFER